MLCPQQLIDEAHRVGIEFWTGVPDSVLKSFCSLLATPHPGHVHVPAANEGCAIGLAVGYHLASGKIPGVYLQNSGLGNAINPLTSVCGPEVYACPMVLFVGWRGEPGTQDEPQHRHMGKVTAAMLEALEIPSLVLSKEQHHAHAQLDQAYAMAQQRQGPVAVLVSRKSFKSMEEKPASVRTLRWSREQAIQKITECLPTGSIVVATTGKAGRELFEQRQASGRSGALDFLNVGGMGHASQIALGMALAQPDRWVLCLDGDGSAIMHLGGLAGVGHCVPKNLVHVVLNNGAHDSVGGQPSLAGAVEFGALARACGYRVVKSGLRGVEPVVDAVANLEKGPYFFEVPIACGARADLGRPSLSCAERQLRFVQALRASDAGRPLEPEKVA